MIEKAGPTKLRKRELVTLAREQSDVLAFADRNREIEELPSGLETGETMRRKRGNRTDRDCIDEICELIAQGITVMASVRYVGVPYATWHKWTKLNHEKSVPSISDIQYFSIQMLRLPPSSVLHRIFTRYCLPDAAARVRADNIQWLRENGIKPVETNAIYAIGNKPSAPGFGAP